MTTASELITRGLRLINVPGRGALLDGQDQLNAFETLKDIIATESVSKSFVPGINRHFFALTPNRAIYSYGPGGDFDTNPFGDLVPVDVEDQYIREGGQILNNQEVTNGDFSVLTGWTLGTGWTIGAGLLTIATGNAGETASQSLSLTAGEYALKITPSHRDGSVTVTVTDGVATPINLVLLGSGQQTHRFTHSGGTAAITLTAAADSDMDFDDISIIERGKDELELQDPAVSGGGSDYTVTRIDQKRYNRRFTKGTGGRPYEMLFSRRFPLAEIRFDNAAVQGDILVMDVLVAKQVQDLSSEIACHAQAEKWIKYKIADEMAPEYGKTLTRRQIQIMNEAWDLMATSNKRNNARRVDRALRGRPTFDVNRGDP